MEKQPNLESQEMQSDKKRKIWDEKMAQMLKPDEYEYVLDEKIRETIIALNVLGINTTQSDQGNYSDSPQIQFEAPEPQNFYVGEDDLRNKVLEQKKLQSEIMDKNSTLFDRSTQVDVLVASRDELMKNQTEYTPEFMKYLEETQKMVEKMQSLIDDYYSHSINLHNKEIRVEISYPYSGSQYPTYLHQLPILNVSVPEHGNSEQEVKAILARTQAEILKFTEYLKNKFFQEK